MSSTIYIVTYESTTDNSTTTYIFKSLKEAKEKCDEKKDYRNFDVFVNKYKFGEELKIDQDKAIYETHFPAYFYKIRVGNLPENIDKKQLNELFCRYGGIRSIKLKNSFAFIKFEDRRDAQDAIDNMNDSYFKEKRIIVTKA